MNILLLLVSNNRNRITKILHVTANSHKQKKGKYRQVIRLKEIHQIMRLSKK